MNRLVLELKYNPVQYLHIRKKQNFKKVKHYKYGHVLLKKTKINIGYFIHKLNNVTYPHQKETSSVLKKHKKLI